MILIQNFFNKIQNSTNKELIDEINGSFLINIDDVNYYFIDFSKKSIVLTNENNKNYDCLINISKNDFISFISKEISFDELFTQGKIACEGSFAMLFKFKLLVNFE